MERIIDLENQRYADREYEGVLLASGAAEEEARASRAREALARLRSRALRGDALAADVLALLGLDA